MADVDNNVGLAGSATAQLHRFLYLGTEGNLWRPAQSAYLPDNLSIQTLLDEGQGLDTIKEITRFHKECWFVNSDTIAYAFAIVTRTTNSEVKNAAFAAMKEVCNSPEAMLAFVHYNEKLSAPKTGWGRFIRRFLSDWYNGKDAKDLAVETTRVVSYKKWTHKDVLCLAHVKPKKTGTAAVLKYLMKGLEQAVKDFGEDPDAQEVLTYLKAVHELKHTTDHHVVARLIEMHDLSFEHIPSKLLKSREIWTCLIPKLKLHVLLRQLPRFHKLSLLKVNSMHTKALLERLRDENALSSGNLGPLETLLPIRQWEACNRPGVPGRTVVRQNIPQLEEAMMNLHVGSFKMVPSTGKRYLVAVDVRSTMVNTNAAGSSSLSPADVSAVILMALARSDVSNVTALGFSAKELVSIDINNKMSLADVAQRMRNIPMGPVDFLAPIQWALEKKKAFDVIVLFTDNQPSRGNLSAAEVLKQYKEALNLPNTRYVSCALCCHELQIASPDEPDMLDIAGFHVNLIRVIQDFARRVF